MSDGARLKPGIGTPKSMLLATNSHLIQGKLFPSLCFTLPTQFFQGGFQLEIHKYEGNPAGFSGSGCILLAPVAIFKQV